MPFLKLKKPFGGMVSLRDFDPGLSDLVALLIGAKPVLYTDFDPDSWDYIRAFCDKLRLEYVFPEEMYGVKGFKAVPASGKKMLLIGRRRRDVMKAAESWHRSPTDPEWGVLLGYPECCVKAYIGWRAVADRTGLIDFTLNNTAEKEGLDFTLNNIFNYFSRLTGRPGDMEDFRRLRALNSGLDIAALQVISWHPCSYNCRKSSAIGGEILRFLAEYLPGRALQLKGALARPVLFGGKYNYAVLDGVASGGVVSYSGLLPPASLLAPETVKALSNSDSLAVKDGSVKAWKHGAPARGNDVAGQFSLLDFTLKKGKM